MQSPWHQDEPCPCGQASQLYAKCEPQFTLATEMDNNWSYRLSHRPFYRQNTSDLVFVYNSQVYLPLFMGGPLQMYPLGSSHCASFHFPVGYM